MRCRAFALFAAFSSVGFAQDSTRKVSIDVRASRVPVVLEALSKAGQIKLEAATNVASDVLVISVKDAPVSEVMKRIATVTASEWKAIDGGFRLVADSAARRKERAAEEKTRLDGLNKDLQKRWDEATKSKDPKAPMIGGKAQVALIKLVAGLDRRAMAQVRRGDRLVFSTAPTAMQLSLGSSAGSLIDEYVAEHNKGLAGAKAEVDAEMDQLKGMPDFIKELALRQTRRIERASKALIVVSRQSMIDMLQVELKLYDDKGAIVGTDSTVVNEGDLMAAAFDVANIDPTTGQPKPKTDKPKVEKSTPIEYGEDAKVFEGLRGAMQSANLKIAPATLAKIKKPEEFDPLSFRETDELFACAKALNVNLVANVPDDADSLISSFFGGKATVETVVESFDGKGKLRRIEDAGWLTLIPKLPETSRNIRLDRFALGTLVRASMAKGIASLDDVAAYALRSPDPQDGGIGQTWFGMFVPGAMSMTMGGVTSWDMLRFYGSIDAQSKDVLARGGRLPIASLNGVQRAALEHMVYGADGHLEVSRQGQAEATDFLSRMMMRFASAGGKDYLDEPTESLAGGLPSDGYVTLKVESEPTVSPVIPDGAIPMAGMAALGPDELAIFKMMKEDKTLGPSVGEFMPSFQKVRVGSRAKYEFSFHFTPVLGRSETLMDHHSSKDAAAIDFNALPGDVNATIDQRLAAIKKSPFGSMLGALGAMGGLGARRGAQP